MKEEPAEAPCRVLVIEDEAPVRAFLRASLVPRGYRVIEGSDGATGLRLAAEWSPEAILLDLGLPDMDGLEVLRRLREWTRAPVIVISARGREAQKVLALDAGADDYVTKPFGVLELVARLRAALRRVDGPATGGDGPFRAGGLVVDLARRRVLVGERPVHLTPMEYRILKTLVLHAGRVVTHRQILQEVWGPDSEELTHHLRVHVAHLRRKLEEDPGHPRLLFTEAGVGYRLLEAT